MCKKTAGLLLSLVLALHLVLFCGRAAALDIVVTDSGDPGPNTLRAAIEQANASFGGDTITFAPSVTRIRPATPLPAINDPTGGITIDGNRTVILDGSLTNDIGLLLSSNNNAIIEMIIVDFGSNSGIFLDNADNNSIRGCWVGTDGVSADVRNSSGIALASSISNQIGGPNPEDRNVVSGNFSTAILLLGVVTANNLIEGNYIGTDVTGAFALGNGGDGIFISGAQNNTIRDNVISGSGFTGIFVADGEATGNRIESNIIGLNAAGTAALPNVVYGVYVGRPGNYIGGPGAGNVISGNASHGIALASAADAEIQDNIIGLGVDGVTPLGNGGHGISIDNQSTAVLVGGLAEDEGNTITANAMAGIAIANNSDGVIVRGNRIGTALDGVTAVGSQIKGIILSNTVNVEIGGAVAAAANTIAYHVEEGVYGTAPEVNDITVRHNSIHSNGLAGISWLSGANPGATAPAITSVEPIAGTTVPLSVVEIFADSAEEGRTLIDTVQANPGGTFSSTANLGAYAGLNLTATATVPGGSTSEFSAPVLIDIEITSHTADQDGNNLISLNELLRLIQFFNSTGYGCEAGTEDGYKPNDSDTGCAPHASDYAPQNWVITLSELLRLIQFFNSGGVHPCPGDGTEDGFCLGLP